MRLLHFDDETGRLILTEFSGRAVPPYAILSYRWNSDPNSEVLFEDLANDTWKTKAGYPKVKFCAEQASQDRLRYFWIDTCCIDKWNRYERSKAVCRRCTATDCAGSIFSKVPARCAWSSRH
ncbi:hypothetical protein GQ44DRAFT_720537 [Phaeosphaeriaceae sp. PMI808]|nr:hypothetical protein GQ44DRAFT_720537 [Phaeosphaeriaceae sp. PMI808]